MDTTQFPTLTPYIVVSDGNAAIEFYQKALGATVLNVAHVPGTTRIMNAQLQVGDSVLMLNDEFPDWGVVAPKPGDTVHGTIHINSHDIEADWARAVNAGATVCMELADMFWGDRYGSFTCPFNYKWSMGQKVRDVSPEEMEAAMAQMGQ